MKCLLQEEGKSCYGRLYTIRIYSAITASNFLQKNDYFCNNQVAGKAGYINESALPSIPSMQNLNSIIETFPSQKVRLAAFVDRNLVQ